MRGKLHLISAALFLASASLLSAQAQPIDGLFGTVEIKSDNLSALPQWNRVIKSFSELKKSADACDQDILKCSSQQMTLWRTKIQELEYAKPRTKVREINQFINKWQKLSDPDAYNAEDYWATPLEFLTRGGDSEDFAIMKYVSLKELGIPPEKMRIVVTNDVLRGKNHAVLSLKANNKQFVLDSQTDTVLSEDRVKYYIPFYSANEKSRWAHIPGHIARMGNIEGIKQ
jgi:predicted transglutaminase-like cysteine proteinase